MEGPTAIRDGREERRVGEDVPHEGRNRVVGNDEQRPPVAIDRVAEPGDDRRRGRVRRGQWLDAERIFGSLGECRRLRAGVWAHHVEPTTREVARCCLRQPLSGRVTERVGHGSS